MLPSTPQCQHLYNKCIEFTTGIVFAYSRFFGKLPLQMSSELKRNADLRQIRVIIRLSSAFGNKTWAHIDTCYK